MRVGMFISLNKLKIFLPLKITAVANFSFSLLSHQHMFRNMMFFINFKKEDIQMKKFIVLVSAAMMSAAVMAAPAEKAANKVEDKVSTSKTTKSSKTKAATGTAATGAAATTLDASGVKSASGIK
ncbi:hypothetical protein [Neisseria dentiae]|uniref:hypothetical protein n=1 Tax=Neisseria dentiae TaxID=194197 RepID=UPI00359F9A08